VGGLGAALVLDLLAIGLQVGELTAELQRRQVRVLGHAFSFLPAGVAAGRSGPALLGLYQHRHDVGLGELHIADGSEGCKRISGQHEQLDLLQPVLGLPGQGDTIEPRPLGPVGPFLSLVTGWGYHGPPRAQ